MTRLSIFLDELGHPIGASVIYNWDTDRESVRPVGVGPFDTAVEVCAELVTMVDIQQALW